MRRHNGINTFFVFYNFIKFLGHGREFLGNEWPIGVMDLKCNQFTLQLNIQSMITKVIVDDGTLHLLELIHAQEVKVTRWPATRTFFFGRNPCFPYDKSSDEENDEKEEKEENEENEENVCREHYG